MSTETNYESLYKQALHHLRCVSESRNAFTTEVINLLWHNEYDIKELRTPYVENLHKQAADFLTKHDK